MPIFKFNRYHTFLFYRDNQEEYKKFQDYFGDNEWILKGSIEEINQMINEILDHDYIMDNAIYRFQNGGLGSVSKN